MEVWRLILVPHLIATGPIRSLTFKGEILSSHTDC